MSGSHLRVKLSLLVFPDELRIIAGQNNELDRKKRKVAGSDGSESPGPPTYSHWLMKSEPESRLENGVDVKVRSSFFG